MPVLGILFIYFTVVVVLALGDKGGQIAFMLIIFYFVCFILTSAVVQKQ